MAIEFRSFSKTAGFTGTRCAFTVVPKELDGPRRPAASGSPLHALWNRRHTTKFNGVAYPIQKAAAGGLHRRRARPQCEANIDYYMENARIIREGLTRPAHRLRRRATRPTSG